MLEKIENKEMSFADIEKMARSFKNSNMFTGITADQATVKILAGRELGIPPFASVSGIHVVQGKPTISAAMVATLIANSPLYSYKVIKSTAEACEIEFFNNLGSTRDSAGIASFTIEEARQAKLAGKEVWKNYASDMLFARAITRGARRFCPGIFGGAPVYTHEEMESVQIKTVTPYPVALIADNKDEDLKLIQESISDFVGKADQCESLVELKDTFSICWKTLKGLEKYREAKDAMVIAKEVAQKVKVQFVDKEEVSE